ncbi:siderophore synthetase component [Kitasatospora sp. MAP12-15]|uniref:IucA/IucC family protein n=1 Tax=unclassified Kitasatospora TaxID=2633591 RepID=UPI002476C951|nr:IucA/IucC family protein [Kitasatospora sp. MAP12-44]MDH6108955.1 siderophore synthetase component [Kitasatospora sp. MAP12-44]
MTPHDALALRVLGALLREDVLGLRTRSTPVDRADGRWLRLDARPTAVFALAVAPDGFQCEYAVRRPLLEVDGVQLTDLDAMLAALATAADPADRPGHLAFAEECRQTLATMLLHEGHQPDVHEQLAKRYGSDPADWTGLGDSLAFDTLAAFLDHPVYPTARGRSGLTDDQVVGYTPEFHPSFELRWLAVPQGALTVHGDAPLPDWWPTPATLGLSRLGGDHLTIPVHPLSVGTPLTQALAQAGLTGRAVLAERPYLEVVPTLSTRTVAVAADPAVHLKLPLATATLGLRNRRTIKPGTLRDGAAGQRLLAAVIEREPRFRPSILLADEQCYAHADHELLAVLARRQPACLADSVTLPLAALAAPAPSGRLVLDHLADRFHAGDPIALYDDLLTLLLDWQTTLFGYGIALESHQQNTSLVLDRHEGRTRMRLLYKDNDGLRVHTPRALARLGQQSLAVQEFDDARIFGTEDRALTDLFATITGHLCTASLAFALAEPGRSPLEHTLGLLRARLTEALDRLGPAGDPLRAALLTADRLPVKAMVTAGTLLSKERSGATDVNKHYTTGPNYLLMSGT